MAMTFKTNLVPDQNLVRELGSSTAKWKIYGDLTGNAVYDGDGNTITDTYVQKSGDTMTGYLTISGEIGMNTRLYLQDNYISANAKMMLCYGNDSDSSVAGRHGLYSYGYGTKDNFTNNPTWMLYRKAVDGSVILNGTASENVAKSGDTMTGNLTVTNTVPEITVKASTSNIAVSLSTSSNNKRHGVWTYGYSSDGTSLTSDGKWMIYRDGNGNIIVNGQSTENVLKSGDTMTGNLYVEKSSDPSIEVVDTSNNNLTARLLVGSGHINHGLYSNGYAPTASTYTSSGKWIIYRGSDGEAHSGLKIYGAVWNDYAEMRKSNVIEPGRCVIEVGDGTMVLSTERLQRGCKVTSDTYGFCIGQTEDYNTPIAVSGRALVYLNESREEALSHIGYPVCSGPNGTVSIMTDEEEEKYPSRIVGTISEVPDYEIWQAGVNEEPQDIKVNGRIWIYVK